MRSHVKSIGRRRPLAGAAAILSMLLILTACGSGAKGTPSKSGSSYPQKAVTLVVPFSAGGSTDLGGRVIASALEKEWGVTVSILNQPGGNTVPAVQSVRQSDPDGSKILFDNQPASSMLKAAVPGLPFEMTDRTFIATAGATPMLFIVPADSPLKTLEDAAKFMKKDPTGFTWTSLGGAGAQDFAFRQLFRDIGIDVNKTRAVSLPGGADAVTQTAGGHVDIGVGTWAAVESVYKGGLVRVLAVADQKRFYALPEIPHAGEAGFPKIEALYWIGFSGPTGIPDNVVRKWNETLAKVLVDPKVIEGLRKVGIVPFYKTQEEMTAFVLKERDQVNELFGIKP